MANDFIGNDELRGRTATERLVGMIERRQRKEQSAADKLAKQENKQAAGFYAGLRKAAAPRFSIGGFARSGYQNTGGTVSSSVKQAFLNRGQQVAPGVRYSPHRGPSGLGQPVFTEENEHGYGSLRTNGLREYSER